MFNAGIYYVINDSIDNYACVSFPREIA